MVNDIDLTELWFVCVFYLQRVASRNAVIHLDPVAPAGWDKYPL